MFCDIFYKVSIYNVFSIQPNSTTKEKQLEAWGRLVIDFCHHLSLYTVDLNELSCSELFCNQKLNRRLNLDGIKTVFEYLEQKGSDLILIFLS